MSTQAFFKTAGLILLNYDIQILDLYTKGRGFEEVLRIIRV